MKFKILFIFILLFFFELFSISGTKSSDSKWAYDFTWVRIKLFYSLQDDTLFIDNFEVKQSGLILYTISNQFLNSYFDEKLNKEIFEIEVELESKFGLFHSIFDMKIRGELDAVNNKLNLTEVKTINFHE